MECTKIRFLRVGKVVVIEILKSDFTENINFYSNEFKFE